MNNLYTFFSLLLLILIPILTYAQEQIQNETNIKIGLAKSYQPSFRINNKSFSNTTSTIFKVLFYEPNIAPIEMGFFITTGRNSTIDYFYGISPAYFLFKRKKYLLKAGIQIGRFKLGKYQKDIFAGARLEDEYQQAFQPYLEWDWQISNYISIISKAGYRFIRSYTRTVTEITDRWENGSIRSYQAKGKSHFYGSGFEFSVGININVY